jgi:hypothetical protein
MNARVDTSGPSTSAQTEHLIPDDEISELSLANESEPGQGNIDEHLDCIDSWVETMDD